MSYTDIPEDQSRIEKKYIYLKQNKIKKRKSENLVRLGCPTCVSKKKNVFFRTQKSIEIFLQCVPKVPKVQSQIMKPKMVFFQF